VAAAVRVVRTGADFAATTVLAALLDAVALLEAAALFEAVALLEAVAVFEAAAVLGAAVRAAAVRVAADRVVAVVGVDFAAAVDDLVARLVTVFTGVLAAAGVRFAVGVAALLAADLVVAFFAAAIVVLLLPLGRVFAVTWCGLDPVLLKLSPGSAGFAVAAVLGVLLALAFPPGVFAVPRVVAFLDLVERPLGLSGRVVGTEPIL
jgi:hypothetical protein